MSERRGIKVQRNWTRLCRSRLAPIPLEFLVTPGFTLSFRDIVDIINACGRIAFVHRVGIIIIGCRIRNAQSVGQSVPPQIAIPSEHFATIIAIIWLDIRVCQHVGLQIGSLIETAATAWTLVW